MKEITTRIQSEKLELVVSNTLQPLNLIYKHNLISKSNTIGIVFVNTKCNELQPYPDYLIKSEKAHELFKSVFEFRDVQTMTNPSKSEIIQKLE